MCGIAGLVGLEPNRKIDRMLGAIEHRGRDAVGAWNSPPLPGGAQICLGHRRLSIIDTGAGANQPFVSADKRFVLTFNGEIYNYKEIRRELETLGARFKTDSDTEVLAEAFARWQLDCLPKLNGMFAFAVWDEREKQLILARDRAGIKPLYYAENAGEFLFASEIKAILAAQSFQPELDREGLHQLLTFLWTVPPHTLFKRIFQVLPGHFLVWKNGAIEQKEWWDVSFDEIENNLTENEWLERVAATLEKAVKMEMIADVPLGAFLSGGVDSSAIVALMTGNSEQKISTFTTGISAEDLRFDIIPDDVKWAREVGRILATDYHETTLQPDLTQLLPKLVWQMDAGD